MWERNASRHITGRDTNWWTVTCIWVVLLGGLLLYVEYLAHTVPGFAAKYSHPSAVAVSLVEDFHLIVPRFLETAWRGAIGIVVAGLMAYPLGALLPCVGTLTRFAFVIMAALLIIPKLAVTLFSQLTLGYGEASLYVIALWVAATYMFATGFLGSLLLHTKQNVEKEADWTFQASALDGPPVWKHYLMVMQMLRAHHVSSLQVLAMAVWTSLTFAEALSVNVIGLGERMHVAADREAIRDQMWSSMLMLIVLEVLSFAAIAYIGRLLNVRTSLAPSQTADHTPSAE